MRVTVRPARVRRAEKKPAADAPPVLLDLRFLELDVLARTRVVLLEAQLLGLGAGVLLRDVKEARVRGAEELDLDGCRLGHRTVPNLEKRKAALTPLLRRAP